MRAAFHHQCGGFFPDGNAGVARLLERWLIPEAQKAALHMAVRKPLVYTKVALRNWRAFHKLGVWRVLCPDKFYQYFVLEARPM